MTLPLRRAVTGLLSFAAAEEQALLAAAAFCPGYDRGSPDRWPPYPAAPARSPQLPARSPSPDEDLPACPTRPACSMPLTSEEAGIGMAGCNLACAQAQAGRPDQAARTPAEAIEANPDLRPTPTATPTCGSFGKFPPEDGLAGSLGVDRHPSEGVLCSTPPASAWPTCRTR